MREWILAGMRWEDLHSLGVVIRPGLTLRVACGACKHVSTVDMAALADRLRLDYETRRLGERFVCRECGAPHHDMNFIPWETGMIPRA